MPGVYPTERKPHPSASLAAHIASDGGDAGTPATRQPHTDFYLHTLGEYVAYFSGRPVTYIGEVPGGIQGPASSVTPDGFTRLQSALGLPAQVSEGDEVYLQPEGTEALNGVVDYLRDNFMGIRTADALYCFFGRNAFGQPVAMSIHSFAGGAARLQDRADAHGAGLAGGGGWRAHLSRGWWRRAGAGPARGRAAEPAGAVGAPGAGS